MLFLYLLLLLNHLNNLSYNIIHIQLLLALQLLILYGGGCYWWCRCLLLLCQQWRLNRTTTWCYTAWWPACFITIVTICCCWWWNTKWNTFIRFLNSKQATKIFFKWGKNKNKTQNKIEVGDLKKFFFLWNFSKNEYKFVN